MKSFASASVPPPAPPERGASPPPTGPRPPPTPASIGSDVSTSLADRDDAPSRRGAPRTAARWRNRRSSTAPSGRTRRTARRRARPPRGRVGPPHGMMFIAPFARPATTVSTTGTDLQLQVQRQHRGRHDDERGGAVAVERDHHREDRGADDELHRNGPPVHPTGWVRRDQSSSTRVDRATHVPFRDARERAQRAFSFDDQPHMICRSAPPDTLRTLGWASDASMSVKSPAVVRVRVAGRGCGRGSA